LLAVAVGRVELVMVVLVAAAAVGIEPLLGLLWLLVLHLQLL
jgi:hypothetical protein